MNTKITSVIALAVLSACSTNLPTGRVLTTESGTYTQIASCDYANQDMTTKLRISFDAAANSIVLNGSRTHHGEESSEEVWTGNLKIVEDRYREFAFADSDKVTVTIEGEGEGSFELDIKTLAFGETTYLDLHGNGNDWTVSFEGCRINLNPISAVKDDAAARIDAVIGVGDEDALVDLVERETELDIEYSESDSSLAFVSDSQGRQCRIDFAEPLSGPDSSKIMRASCYFLED